MYSKAEPTSCQMCGWPLAASTPETLAQYRRDFQDSRDAEMSSVCGDCYAYLMHGPASRELVAFVRESNWIEGIHRDPTVVELVAHFTLLRQPVVTLELLEEFVGRVQPGAELRQREGMNVWVGPHPTPPGGPRMRQNVQALLEATGVTPAWRHWHYEKLHPFTDGNGRSGRALWLHNHGGDANGGFLHRWYYESLEQMALSTDRVRH